MVRHIRILLRWAYESDILDRPVKFGPEFKAPSRASLLAAEQQTEMEHAAWKVIASKSPAGDAGSEQFPSLAGPKQFVQSAVDDRHMIGNPHRVIRAHGPGRPSGALAERRSCRTAS
jgi:hypothetical protein